MKFQKGEQHMKLGDKIMTLRRQQGWSQETLAENLFPEKWYNPYPRVRYSERPDEASAALL